MVKKVVHMVQTVVLKKIKHPVSINITIVFPSNVFLKEDEITIQKKITGFFHENCGFFFFFFF
jgi:hypothetical protein